MALIRNISIGFGANTRTFISDTLKAADALDRMAKSSEAAQLAASKVKGGAGTSTGGASELSAGPDAGAIGATLAKNLAPIGQIGARLEPMLDRIGGTVVTMARRIDAAMRFPLLDTLLGRLQAALAGGFGAGTAAAAGFSAAVTATTPPVVNMGQQVATTFASIQRGAAAAQSTAVEIFRPATAIASRFGQTALAAITPNAAAATRLKLTLVDTFAQGTAGAARFGTGLLAAMAAGAVGAVRLGLKIRGALMNWGDVAGKNLTQLFRINGAFASMPAPIAQATTAVKGFGTQIALAFGIVGVVYTAARAVKTFFMMGIKGAMELEESLSKDKEVFGASAQSVIANAERMAKVYKSSKGEILDAAGSIGLIAKGAGQSNEEAAKMANSLSLLAAHASSLYNVPLDESLTKIRAGLVGEAEPLRAFGVLLSETAVKAQAQAMGIKLVKGELSEAGKVTARYALIQKGLVVASGDLDRTMGSTTNQFRMSGGGLQNFATSVGTLLLPAVNLVIASFNELLSSIVETFEAKKDVVTGWANSAKSGIETVVKSVRYFSDYWQVAQLSATQQVANFSAYLSVIPENFKIIADYVASNWVKAIVDALNYVGKAMLNLHTNFNNFNMATANFLIGKGWDFKWQALTDGFTATMAELPALAQPVLTDLSGEMADIFAGIDKKEAARKAAMAPIGATKSPVVATAAAEKEEKYAGTAAVTKGSAEAGSALAKFFNKSSGEATAKETAANTKQTNVILEKIAVSTAYLRAQETGSEVMLAIAKL